MSRPSLVIKPMVDKKIYPEGAHRMPDVRLLGDGLVRESVSYLYLLDFLNILSLSLTPRY